MERRNRFVAGGTTRIQLSDGDEIEVVTRLSHGEEEDMLASMSSVVAGGIGIGTNRRMVRTGKVLAYLVRWNLVDDEGQPIPYSLKISEDERRSLIRNLDPDDFQEIWKAVDKHEDEVQAARDALKKARAGSAGAAPTSPSPSAAAGATSGSEASTPTTTTP
ncbi:MAG: hypothetical protein V4597_08555 [Pseudomonadota bacterium]